MIILGRGLGTTAPTVQTITQPDGSVLYLASSCPAGSILNPYVPTGCQPVSVDVAPLPDPGTLPPVIIDQACPDGMALGPTGCVAVPAAVQCPAPDAIAPLGYYVNPYYPSDGRAQCLPRTCPAGMVPSAAGCVVQATAAAAGSSSTPWLIAGGAAVLLLGGFALLMGRKRAPVPAAAP